jgi:hypothetical protein
VIEKALNQVRDHALSERVENLDQQVVKTELMTLAR